MAFEKRAKVSVIFVVNGAVDAIEFKKYSQGGFNFSAVPIGQIRGGFWVMIFESAWIRDGDSVNKAAAERENAGELTGQVSKPLDLRRMRLHL